MKTAETFKLNTGLAFLLIFALLSVGIGIVARLYYRSYAQHFRSEVERQLSAVAELKVSELSQWRRERLEDGDLMFKNAAFVALVRRFLETPSDSDTHDALLDWIGKFSGHHQYDRAWLLDAQGNTRLSTPRGQQPTAAATLQRASEVLRTGQVWFQDFYRNEHDQQIYLAVMVPIPDNRNNNAPLGTLVLRIDPKIYLYPFISRWPTPSPTAETLLVRREGNDAVFLNNLRFQTNAVLNLRVPLDLITMPAVQAALGREGVFEGVDYQGKLVLAALRSIPDSPWALVARMDKAEVYAPLRERLWVVIIMLTVLILGAGAGVAVVWRQQRVRFYRDRAAATEQILESAVKFKALFENMAAASCVDEVVYKDGQPVDYRVLDINPAFERLTGISRSQAVGSLATQLYGSAPPPFFNTYVKVAETGEPASFEDYFQPLGKYLHVTAIRPARGQFSTIFTDITERTLAASALRKSAANLARSNQELEQFAYVASHDLQEPLRMVASYTQLLAKRYGDRLDQDARDFIGYAVDGAVRMQRLINDLLAFSRVQTQAKSMDDVDSHAALGEALVNLAAAIEESGALITNGDLPWVRADQTQLVQVFQNLISNALKFRDVNSPHVSVSAKRDSAAHMASEVPDALFASSGPRPQRPEFWIFSVRDNGIGIEPQYFERIFVIFQRLHSQAKYPGTGIGLALCKRIVERHGGRIWVESEFGKGTTFHFTWPGTEGEQR